MAETERGVAEAKRCVAEVQKWVSEAERWVVEAERWVAVPRQRDGRLRYGTEKGGSGREMGG